MRPKMNKCPKCRAPLLNPHLPQLGVRTYECGYEEVFIGVGKSRKEWHKQRPCAAGNVTLHQFKVEISWTMTDRTTIFALDKDHAGQIILDAPLTPGEYLDHSFSIDDIELIE